MESKKLLLWIALALSACATAAQEQFKIMSGEVRAVSQKATECVKTVAEKYPDLTRRMPITDVSPTLDQLGYEEPPTEEEVQQIIDRHNDASECRAMTLSELAKVLPGFIQIMVDSYFQVDLVLVEMIKRRITWADANKQRMKILTELRTKAKAFDSELTRNFEAWHRDELAQRQAAAIILLNWTVQQTALFQNQQLINNLRRPVVTSCSGSAYSVSCVTTR